MTKKAKTKKIDLSESFGRMLARMGKSEGFNRFLNVALSCLIVVGVLGGGYAGLKYLERYVDRLSIFTTSEVSVCLYSQPSWMSEPLAREILIESFKPMHDRLVRIHREGKDRDLPGVLAEQLRRNAWVSKVYWIRRSFGGQFVINCQFREPTALVNMNDWCYLVDGEGYLLPGKYRHTALAGCGMLEIHGCAGPVPEAGAKWAGADLQAGLRLVKLLAVVPFREKVKAVDVANFKGRKDPRACWIALRTDHDTTVRWGKPVGEERGLENTAAQKLALLARIYHDTGHIDYGRAYVDVRNSPNGVDVPIAVAERRDFQDDPEARP